MNYSHEARRRHKELLALCELAQKKETTQDHHSIVSLSYGPQALLIPGPEGSLKTLTIACRGTEGPLRGTEFLKDWLLNFNTTKNYIGSDMYCHRGYYRAALDIINSVSPYLEGVDKVVVVGHSQGGALALLLSYLIARRKKPTLSPSTYTYAAPKIVNETLAKEILGTVDVFQWASLGDPVPRLPLFSSFEHVNVKWIGSRWDFGFNHFTSHYRELLT